MQTSTTAGLVGLSTVSTWGSDLEGLAGFSGGLAQSGFSSEACWSAVAMEPMEKPSRGVAPTSSFIGSGQSHSLST